MDAVVVSVSFIYLLILLPYKLDRLKAFFIFLLLLIISGFRAQTEGVDLPNYLYSFQNYDLYENNTSIEPGYKFFNSVIGSYFKSDFLYILFTSMLVIVPLYYFLIKESRNISLSLFLWVILAYYTESFNIIRQSISISFLLCAFYNFEAKNRKYGALFSILAFSFHYSSIFTLPIYLLCKKISIKPGFTLIAITSSIVIGLSGILKLNIIELNLSPILSYIGQYEMKAYRFFNDPNMYDRGLLGFIFIYIPSSIYTIIVAYFDKRNSVYLKMLIVATFSQNLLYYIGVIDRIVLYTLVLQIVVFVNLYEENRKKLAIPMGVFVFYYFMLVLYRYTNHNLSGVYPYEFINF